MKVIGDLKYANKFCVETPDRGIIWVPSLDIAKQYVNDPRNEDWYGKPIIASYEQVVQAHDGKFYFRSNAPAKPVELQQEDVVKEFKKQSKRKIDKELENYATEKGFDSFSELLSFSVSSLKSYKELAKEAAKYRDVLYKYTDGFIDKMMKKKSENVRDVSDLYDEYLVNFPFM